MDGGEDQVILVQQRDARLVGGRVRRIQGQVGQEPLARRIAGRDLLQLQQVSQPDVGILVDALQMGLVPKPRAAKFGRPARLARANV